MTDLKTELRAKLEGSSSRSPVDISVLSAGRHRRRVEIALMEMYQEREVGCCKISKRDKATTHITETTVWWVSCTVTSPDWYGIRGKGPSIKPVDEVLGKPTPSKPRSKMPDTVKAALKPSSN